MTTQLKDVDAAIEAVETNGSTKVKEETRVIGRNPLLTRITQEDYDKGSDFIFAKLDAFFPNIEHNKTRTKKLIDEFYEWKANEVERNRLKEIDELKARLAELGEEI